MIRREAIKADVRRRLSVSSGNTVLCCLILVLLGSFPGAICSALSYFSPFLNLSGSFFQLMYLIFFGEILALGGLGWFLCYARGENPEVSRVFGAFRFYGRALAVTVLQGLYVFLWSLLLIVPGIIKAYSYSMAGYIVCENPLISASDALRLSERMTAGRKGELFELDLSFLGWFLLGALTLGILNIVYVEPYYRTVHATYYLTLKEAALREGRIRPEELGLRPAQPATPAAP